MYTKDSIFFYNTFPCPSSTKPLSSRQKEKKILPIYFFFSFSSTFCLYGCACSGHLHINGIMQYITICIWFLSFKIMFLRFIHYIVCFSTLFLWLNNIVLNGYTIFYLSIHQLMDIWFPHFFLCIWTSMEIQSICSCIFFILFSDECFSGALLDAIQVMNFKKTIHTFIQKILLVWTSNNNVINWLSSIPYLNPSLT